MNKKDFLLLGFLISLSVMLCAMPINKVQAQDGAMALKMKSFLGKPVTSFIDETSLAPTSEYTTTQGKTFIFIKSATQYIPPVNVNTGGGYYNDPAIGQAAANLGPALSTPGYYRNMQCTVHIKTKNKTKSENLDEYIIDQIDWDGPC